MDSISIKNFRKFLTLSDLRLGDITYLIGDNNSGKSTITKALRMFGNVLASNFLGVLSELNIMSSTNEQLGLDGFFPSLCNRATNPWFSIQGQFGNFRMTILVDGQWEKLSEYFGLGKFNYNDYDDPDKCEETIRQCEETIRQCFKRVVTNPEEFESFIKSAGIKDGALRYIRMEDISRNVVFENDYGFDTCIRLDGVVHSISASWKGYSLADEEEFLCLENYFTESDIHEENKLHRYNELKALINQEETVIFDCCLGLGRCFGLPDFIKSARSRQLTAKESTLVSYLNDMVRDFARVVNCRLYYLPHGSAQWEETICIDRMVYREDGFWYHEGEINVCEHPEAYAFITEWMDMDHLRIGDDVRFSEEDGNYYIRKNGCELKMTYMSVGEMQLMTLLLRIGQAIAEDTETPAILIVEEPEQNLHPCRQSMLDDLFYQAHRQFGYQFIVETHSEYIVRHSQINVKTLKGENPYVVQYCVGDEPIEMQYDESGHFMNDPTDGFFDENGKLYNQLNQ